MHMKSSTNVQTRRPRQRGFTIMQMIVTICIITVLSTVGFWGIMTARAEMRVQNSARMFAVFIEKARADSVRRHVTPGQEATVQTFGPGTNTFNVTMDFDGHGTL